MLAVGLLLPSVGRAPAQVGGCGGPARVVAVSRTHRPRIAEQPLRGGEAIADRRGDPRAARWLAAPVPARSLLAARRAARVRLECAATRIIAGRMSLVAARSDPTRAVLATPQARFTATVAESHADVAVGRRTRIWVRSGAGRVMSAAAAGQLEAHAGDAAS